MDSLIGNFPVRLTWSFNDTTPGYTYRMTPLNNGNNLVFNVDYIRNKDMIIVDNMRATSSEVILSTGFRLSVPTGKSVITFNVTQGQTTISRS